MKLRITLSIVILCILTLFVGCDKGLEEKIVNKNLDETNSNTTNSGINVIEEKDDDDINTEKIHEEDENKNIAYYTYDTLNEYFELGTQATV